jgi:hypothetical protein
MNKIVLFLFSMFLINSNECIFCTFLYVHENEIMSVKSRYTQDVAIDCVIRGFTYVNDIRAVVSGFSNNNNPIIIISDTEVGYLFNIEYTLIS